MTDVIGKTLYVTSTSGSLVKVTLAPSTAITRNTKSTLSNLKVGDSVVVSGVKAGEWSADGLIDLRDRCGRQCRRRPRGPLWRWRRDGRHRVQRLSSRISAGRLRIRSGPQLFRFEP